MNQKHRGALSELTATAWLLQKGFEVFRNVSAHGDVDLIARNPQTQELLQIDVTTGSHYIKRDGTKVLNYNKTKDKKVGISVIVLPPEGDPVWLGREVLE